MIHRRRLALALGFLIAFSLGAGGAAAGPDDEKDAAATASQRASVQAGAVRVQATLSNGFYSASVPRRLVLRLDMTADARAAARRSPLNLALVIDRSGSMVEEDKFVHAMNAVRMVIQNLSDRDVVSLVAFSDAATVIAPAARAVDKKFLAHRLHELEPKGYTNLSAGLLEGLAQIDASAVEGQTRRVVVLTDGIANRGVTDAGQLRRLAASARGRGIGISTIGVGTKFDGGLLTAMAEAGGGRYTYVRTSEQIPDAVAREVDGLLAVVAQNVRLEVRADKGTRLVNEQGQPLGTSSAPVRIPIGDVRSGEQGVFLIDLAPQRIAEGGTSGATLVLTLDRPDTGRRERKSLRVRALFTTEAGAVGRSEDAGVSMYALLLSAVSLAEDALLGRDIAGYREAVALFGRLHGKAKRIAQASGDRALLNEASGLLHFLGELEDARKGGGLHDHDDAWAEMKNAIDYRRYLRQHHHSEK